MDRERLRMPTSASCAGEIVWSRVPAPVVWCYSLQGWLRERLGQTAWIAKLFEPRNLPILAAFAVLDAIAIKLGKTTSNQQLIAMRSAAAEARKNSLSALGGNTRINLQSPDKQNPASP